MYLAEVNAVHSFVSLVTLQLWVPVGPRTCLSGTGELTSRGHAARLERLSPTSS